MLFVHQPCLGNEMIECVLLSRETSFSYREKIAPSRMENFQGEVFFDALDLRYQSRDGLGATNTRTFNRALVWLRTP